MGEKKWDETLGEALTKAEEYHFVRIITREGAAIRPLLSGNILEAVGSRKRSGTDQKEQTVLGKGSGRDRKNGTILSGVFKSGCGRSHIE